MCKFDYAMTQVFKFFFNAHYKYYWVGFYQILYSVLKYLIMEEYKTFSCVWISKSLVGGSKGSTSLRKRNTTKSKVSLCYCSKEEWYHSLPFTKQDFKLINFNFHCFAEPRNFCKLRYYTYLHNILIKVELWREHTYMYPVHTCALLLFMSSQIKHCIIYTLCHHTN